MELATHAEVEAGKVDTAETMRPQLVPVNVYEASGALVVVAPLPAVIADDVTVYRSESSLRLVARLRSAPPRSYLVHEWEYGGYERVIEVPPGYGSTLEVSLANGQLVIRLLRGEFTGPSEVTPDRRS